MNEKRADYRHTEYIPFVGREHLILTERWLEDWLTQLRVEVKLWIPVKSDHIPSQARVEVTRPDSH